jgi:hypothetical protein
LPNTGDRRVRDLRCAWGVAFLFISITRSV